MAARATRVLTLDGRSIDRQLEQSAIVVKHLALSVFVTPTRTAFEVDRRDLPLQRCHAETLTRRKMEM